MTIEPQTELISVSWWVDHIFYRSWIYDTPSMQSSRRYQDNQYRGDCVKILLKR